MASNRPCDIPEQELIIKVGNKIASAMASDHPFFMSFKEVQKLFNSQRACAYSGATFSTIGDITFERVNPRLPYIKGNVVLVRKQLNGLKGTTIDRFIHESGMSLDAMADLFAMISRSLRVEFNQQHPRSKNVPVPAPVEEQPVNNNPPEDVPEIPLGRKMLMDVFKGAKKKREGNVNDGEQTPADRHLRGHLKAK